MADLETKLDAALRVIAPKPVAKKTPGGHKWHYFPIQNPLTHGSDDADMRLIVKWIGSHDVAGGYATLTNAQKNEILDATWKLTDAYGGRVPQHWDWSGIRDASTTAKRKMAAVIRKLLKKWGVKP